MMRIKAEIFYIEFDSVLKFSIGEILESNEGRIEVLDIYYPTWWKKILKSIGFNVRVNQIKVIHYETRGKKENV